MRNVQTPTAQADQGLKFIANRILDVTGHPEELEKSQEPLPSTPVDLLTDLYLPTGILKILEEPLKTWGYTLEANETVHQIAKKTIRHFVLRTSVGKMVLIYLRPEVLQDQNPAYWGQFNYFGTLFAKEYKSIFVFSDADNAGLAYKEVLKQWKEIFTFEKVELLLNDVIQVLQTSEIKVVVSEIKERFGLPLQNEEGEAPKVEIRLINTKKLHELLLNHFANDDDLIQLCFDLQEHDLKYENLEGEILKTKFISLISHFDNRAILPVLVDYCKEARKQVSWDEVESSSG